MGEAVGKTLKMKIATKVPNEYRNKEDFYDQFNKKVPVKELYENMVELQHYSYSDLCGIAIMDEYQGFMDMDQREPNLEEIVKFKKKSEGEDTKTSESPTTMPTKGDANVLGSS